MGGDDDKIIRIPGETLVIKLSPEEGAYRQKYLPDAKRLTDEKLVCTVCSVSLAQNIHKGKDLFIHRSLQVLVCEACYNFYGDGCFSTDEDGDDKYCRWCGQGGTLYICSACNCAFCQKCTKQNLKASVLADLENDDWKCYICNPRPLFGCRTICWGAQQLNKIGKEKEAERLRKVKERLEKLEAKKKEANERKSRKVSSSEDEALTKKRKRDSDSDSISPEVMPKKSKRESRNLNGSIGRRKKDSSSNSESENDKKVSRKSRSSSKKEKFVQSSSEDESDRKHKKDKMKKKKKKNSSDESSDTGKKQPKRRSVKKKESTDDESSEDEKSKKKKKPSVKKRNDSTDSSSAEREHKKKKNKKKKKSTSGEESSGETKRRSKKLSKKKYTSSSDKSSDEDESTRRKKNIKSKSDKEDIVKKQDAGDSDNDIKKGKKVTTDSEEVSASTAEDILVKKRIKLAVLWLNTIVKDISELGTLISLRATKFSKKKINAENLKSYEDVLNCVSKIKQLISGVHSNYDHIEKTLDSHLKPWKILTGLEDPENEKHNDGDNSVTVENNVSNAGEITVKSHENTLNDTSENDTHHGMEVTATLKDSKEDKINEQNEENLNNWSDDSDDQNETRALITKANETLDKSQNEDKQSETSEVDRNGDNRVINNEDTPPTEEIKINSDVKEENKSAKSDSDKLVAESKLQTPKKTSKSNIEKEESVDKSNKSKKITESDSESEERSPKKNLEVKKNSNEEKNEEKSENKEDKGKELESEGNKECLQNDPGLIDHGQYSSDDSSQLNSFTLKLKEKWLSGTGSEEMNLKQSLETDFVEKSEKLTPKIVVKKLELLESEEENEIETNNRPRKETSKKTRNVKDVEKFSENENKEDKEKGLDSENEEKQDLQKEEKGRVPKLVLNKLKSSESEGENEIETNNLCKRKKAKKVRNQQNEGRIKGNEKKGKAEDLNSEDEEKHSKKCAVKRKVDKTKSKEISKGDKSNCLSSSHKEDENVSVKVKRKSCKAEGTKKTKKDQSKGLSSSDEDDDKNIKSKRIPDKTKSKKKEKDEKSKHFSSEDEEENKNRKSDSIKKESDVENFKGSSNEEKDEVDKKKTSKEKDIKEKKTKKDVTQDEECDNDENNKSGTREDKLKSKSGKKNKLKEDNCDKESTQSKQIKLKNLKEDNKNENKGKSECNDKDNQDKTNEKAKSLKKNDSSSVGLSSEDESIDTAVVENGKINDDDEAKEEMCADQENAEMSHVKTNDTKDDAENSEKVVDFTLELQASSNENTNEMYIAEENKKISANKQKLNDQDEVEEISDTKYEARSKKKKSKFVGLDSSSDEEMEVKKKKSPKKKSVHNQKKFRNVLVLSSDDDDDDEEEEERLEEPLQIDSSEEDDEKKDEDFTMVVQSSAESSDSEILPKNKRKKKGSSDSDASVSGEETNKKKKRRRIKCADSSDESGGSGDEKIDISQKGNQGESPGKGGRKNIKKIKKKDDLELTTIEAAEEEKERRKRIEERQKLFNQVFEVKQTAKLENLVLDFDPDTKKELISVNKDLVAKMKPHQAKGVKFMWDSCFESVKQIKKTKGSGCILAHCMGLGKTFQVISLIHTLLTHEELTKVRTVMVVCPLSTVLNWYNEFGKWLEGVEGGDDIEVFHLTKFNKNPERAMELRRWQHNGGVLIMGYEMFRNLTNETTKKFKAKLKKDFLETLIDPGADLIVCDEGHMLKNEATALSKAMTRVKTLRRIVLTGTPMQNNLKEYHCMVQFVKPNLLGTSKEFLNRFVNPINNGQFVDSTDHDVKLMKRRAHVLHKMLEGLVQRFDYNVLTPFLPPKQEYVISVCLSELQEKLYSFYLENESQKAEGVKGGARLFMDWQSLGRVWTHPRVLKMSTDKANWLKEKKAMEESDSEGSLRDFIDDGSDKTTTPDDSTDESSSDEDKKKKKVHRSRSTRSTRQTSNVALLESSEDEKNKDDGEEAVVETTKGDWWTEFVEPQHFEDMRQSGKLILLFSILKECELIEDKVLVFSQSLFSLDMIEYFLDKIDAATQEGRLDENLDNHQGNWSKGLDYFRLDGSTSSENRNIWCKSFNREDNPRARLFLISTRAGGLGINLTAANRVIIFDASWNPSHDIQSIFRIYRFGQKKPCYVYRFVAFGTMEEKVYERQVAKQSISNRVVDEQQVHRHFSMNDLTELYTFTPATKLEERPTPTLPRDPLMAEILSQMKVWIEKYHEHDSLLENVVEEELNEEERKAAWEDFENDKKRGFMPPTGPQGQQMNPNAAWNAQIEIMRQQLKARFADKSDEDINSILVYQVSVLMRQQQQKQMEMAAQMKAAGNMGYRPQMYGNNMMGGQMYNQRPQMQTTAYLRNIAPKPTSQQNYSADQVYRMQQQANMMRLQMQQMAQQQKPPQQQSMSGLQSLLAAQLGQTSTNYPTANISAAFNSRAAADLQRMKQNYQAAQTSRQNKSGVVITEITDDKSSKSSGS